MQVTTTTGANQRAALAQELERQAYPYGRSEREDYFKTALIDRSLCDKIINELHSTAAAQTSDARDAARYRAFCAWWIGDDTERHDSFIENIMHVDTKEQMDAHIDAAIAASGEAG
jgi:hypothetical protein